MLFIASQKQVKNMGKTIKIKNHSVKYWDVNIYYGWAISQKLHVDGFKWVENTS